MSNLTKDNVVLGLDPKPEQMDSLTNLLSDEGFVRELKTLLWWVKPNLKFYQGEKWAKLLALILEKFSDTYRILDAKCSDGINTEMGVIREYRDRVDAITIAPASWDDLSFINYLQNPNTWKGVDVIAMWAMSFPGTISDLIQWSYDTQKAKVARNLDAWIAGIVMWATAYNTDVVKELAKLKGKIQEWSIEHACLKWYTDKQLVEWILLRNKLFAELIPLIAENDTTKLLVPGFWRQWWSSDFFIPEFDHSRSRFNAWRDVIKDLESKNVSEARAAVLQRLEAFLTNLKALSVPWLWTRQFTVPAEFEFEKLLHTWSWWDLLWHIWSIYQRPESWAYCRLASELLRDRYINIWAEPERNYLVLERAGNELSEQLNKRLIKADVVMWAQMWSVRMSWVLGRKLWIEESIYAEKDWADNEKMVLKRHKVDLNWKNVILSEDIITQWTTIEKMIQIVKEWWWEVVAITCIWNRYWKDEFEWIPLISCFVPPAFDKWWDEETLARVRAKRLTEWKTRDEIEAEIQKIQAAYPKLLEWSTIAEKPKNVWNDLVQSMRS